MTEKRTILPGLDGSTPLGFLAALGVQAAFTDDEPPTLHWDWNTVAGRPVIGGRTLDEITSQVMRSYTELVESPAVSGTTVADNLKFPNPDATRDYLTAAQAGGRLSASFAAAQVSEGAVITSGNNKGKSKPSALHFTSGKMLFLQIAREVVSCKKNDGLRSLSPELVLDTLKEPGNGLTLLRWGDADGRDHAKCAVSPSEQAERKKIKRITNPALTALALLGMSRYPVWTSDDNRSITQGFFGQHPHEFVWLLWKHPAGQATVGSLLAQVRPDISDAVTKYYAGWGIAVLWSASVKRNSHGYGSFGAARMLWHA